MRIIWAGVAGAAGGAVLVWALATWHHLNLVPMDLQAAVSALIGGALSFLGGYIEHRRSARAAARDAKARPRDAAGQ